MGLRPVRRLVSTEAARAGFTSGPIADLVLAVGEVAANSIEHGGGSGTLRIWRDGGVVSFRARTLERDGIAINNGRAEVKGS